MKILFCKFLLRMGYAYTYFALLRAMQPNSKIETQNANPDRSCTKKDFYIRSAD